jgi:hypothetical protein
VESFWLFCLFAYSRLSDFSTIWLLSLWTAILDQCLALTCTCMDFSSGGSFICQCPLWYATSIFNVLSERQVILAPKCRALEKEKSIPMDSPWQPNFQLDLQIIMSHSPMWRIDRDLIYSINNLFSCYSSLHLHQYSSYNIVHIQLHVLIQLSSVMVCL